MATSTLFSTNSTYIFLNPNTHIKHHHHHHLHYKSHCYSPSPRNSTLSPLTLTLSISLPAKRPPQRSLRIVTRAGGGGPSTNSILFAFLFPLVLMVVTMLTAWKIGLELDEKFLQELAMMEAMKEEEEAEEDDDEAGAGAVVLPRVAEPALPRSRNRPKREV